MKNKKQGGEIRKKRKYSKIKKYLVIVDISKPDPKESIIVQEGQLLPLLLKNLQFLLFSSLYCHPYKSDKLGPEVNLLSLSHSI